MCCNIWLLHHQRGRPLSPYQYCDLCYDKTRSICNLSWRIKMHNPIRNRITVYYKRGTCRFTYVQNCTCLFLSLCDKLMSTSIHALASMVAQYILHQVVSYLLNSSRVLEAQSFRKSSKSCFIVRRIFHPMFIKPKYVWEQVKLKYVIFKLSNIKPSKTSPTYKEWET